MSRIVRRDMLKVMAATAAGVAVGGNGIESVLAATAAPKLANTPFTTYHVLPGWAFEEGASSYTWFNNGTRKFATSGGSFFVQLQPPQGAVITECAFYVVNPTTNVFGYLVSETLGSNAQTIFGSGVTAGASASLQAVIMSVTPTTVDNTLTWYDLDLELLAATDVQIWFARIGWINEPTLTLFPNPRRIINGGPFVNGAVTGPYDATLEYDHVTATGIPAGAKAAFCAVQSYTPGVLTLFPDLTTDPGIANYSGTGTQGFGLNMVYMMVPLSPAGKFKIHSYISGNCYVDAWGYVV